MPLLLHPDRPALALPWTAVSTRHGHGPRSIANAPSAVVALTGAVLGRRLRRITAASLICTATVLTRPRFTVLPSHPRPGRVTPASRVQKENARFDHQIVATTKKGIISPRERPQIMLGAKSITMHYPAPASLYI